MSFADVKGQDRAITFLKNAVIGGRAAHAYIFLGPPGSGKKLAALNFAKALNCLSAPGDRPCDKCASCKKADNGNHPDVMLLKPDKGASSFKIEKIRELIAQINLKAYEGRKKVYIIDEASSLTREAINALLKTLEEPPSDSVLVMLFDNLRYVPRTIISRSQIVRFIPLRTEDGRSASGREEIIGAAARGAFFDIDFDDMTKDELKASLDTMLSWYRDLLIAKLFPDGDAPFFNADRKELIMKTAVRTDSTSISRAMDEIINALSNLDGNANAKLAIGVLGAKIMQKG